MPDFFYTMLITFIRCLLQYLPTSKSDILPWDWIIFVDSFFLTTYLQLQIFIMNYLEGQIFNCNNSLICSFNWTTANEIVYFTSHGIEIYNVQPEKRTVKSVRYMNQLISWLVFCPFSSILVLSASKTVSSLILFHLKNGNVYKLPKIDVDEQQIQNKVEVKEKDIQGRFFYYSKSELSTCSYLTNF